MDNNWQKLSNEQQEIYDLFFNQKLSVSDIANRRQTSRQAVYKTLKKLKENYKVDYKKRGGLHLEGYSSQCKPPKKTNLWRFHGLHFIIKPFYLYPRYHQMRKERGNYGIKFKQFTLVLYEDRIRVQSRKGMGWLDVDKHKAIVKAEEDFNDFLNFAAKRYGFEFEKDGRISIKLVSSELAREDSKFANKYTEVSNENILLVRDANNKICFLIDRSKGVAEHEYVGRNTYTNSEKIELYIQDLLYNEPLTNSQLASRISDLIIALQEQKELNKIIFARLDDANKRF